MWNVHVQFAFRFLFQNLAHCNSLVIDFTLIIKAHSFPRQNLKNSAANLVNSASHYGNTDEIPRLHRSSSMAWLNHESTSQIHVMNLWILHYLLTNHFHQSTTHHQTKNQHKQTCNKATLRSFSVKKKVVGMKNIKFRIISRQKDEFRGNIPWLDSAVKTQNARLEIPRSAENFGP